MSTLIAINCTFAGKDVKGPTEVRSLGAQPWVNTALCIQKLIYQQPGCKSHFRIVYSPPATSRLVLKLIDLDFDVIVLSEVWTYNMQFYKNIFSNYSLFHDFPVDSNIGGVGMYIKNDLNPKLNTSLHLESNLSCKVESVWLLIVKQGVTFNIGGIYRHTGHSIAEFSNRLDKILTKFNAKNVPQ